MKAHARTVVGLLSVVAMTGCKFSASASGNVNTGGEGSLSAEADSAEASAPPPAEEGAIVYKEGKLDYRGVINFEYDKARLRGDPQTGETLAEFERFLKQHADVSIEIEGHTDSRGSDAYNRELSDRRAAAVRDWLVERGIAADRVTAVGKGEDEPQVPEPAECKDQHPADTTPCEGVWAQNRRVVFEVTGGAETLPEPEPPPPPAPEPEPVVAAEPAPECPWLWGGHGNLIGPNSWLVLAGAVQPGVCWLEPSLGLGLGFGGIDAENPPAATEGDGSYLVLNIPLRARIWFMNTHSVIGDVGLGLSRYFISADLTDSAGATADYSRNSTEFYGHLGAGYGFRPNGFEAGPRLAVVIGALLHFGDLGDSTVDAPAGFNGLELAALQAALDADSDGLTDLEPYAEVSFGWLF